MEHLLEWEEFNESYSDRIPAVDNIANYICKNEFGKPDFKKTLKQVCDDFEESSLTDMMAINKFLIVTGFNREVSSSDTVDTILKYLKNNNDMNASYLKDNIQTFLDYIRKFRGYK